MHTYLSWRTQDENISQEVEVYGSYYTWSVNIASANIASFLELLFCNLPNFHWTQAASTLTDVA